MARFEIEANIKRFQRLLSEVGMDPAQRQVVARLLVEEKEKLAKLNRTERAE
jgi:phage terminase small subunit